MSTHKAHSLRGPGDEPCDYTLIIRLILESTCVDTELAGVAEVKQNLERRAVDSVKLHGSVRDFLHFGRER
jgi:hypothetical protein